LDRADEESKSLGDAYVSPRLFLALAMRKTRRAAAVSAAGVSRTTCSRPLKRARRPSGADQEPENSIRRCTLHRDLTELARKGQARSGHRPRRGDSARHAVLSRRTKNIPY